MWDKATEGAALFRDKWARRSDETSFSWLFRDLEQYDQLLSRHAGLALADAAAIDLPEASFDLVFSEDVFEHLEPSTLQELTARIARWLGPNGIALIRPNVWTGITGGHLVEWSRRSLVHPPARRKSEPWD